MTQHSNYDQVRRHEKLFRPAEPTLREELQRRDRLSHAEIDMMFEEVSDVDFDTRTEAVEVIFGEEYLDFVDDAELRTYYRADSDEQ